MIWKRSRPLGGTGRVGACASPVAAATSNPPPARMLRRVGRCNRAILVCSTGMAVLDPIVHPRSRQLEFGLLVLDHVLHRVRAARFDPDRVPEAQARKTGPKNLEHEFDRK